MKRHILKRLLILYLLLFLLSILFVEFYITSVYRDNYISNISSSLYIQAGLISKEIPFERGELSDSKCIASKKETGHRVTIIDNNGKVTCDSDHDSSLMDNHSDRPEIQQALRASKGIAVRYSDTLNFDYLYIARKIIKNDKTALFVRLAVPLKAINSSINKLRLKINLVIILLIFTLGTIIIWQTEKIRKFIALITNYAVQLSHGDLKNRLHLSDAGEFSDLTESLNRMASELEYYIDKKEKEAERLSVILKSIPDALLLIDNSGMITLHNNAATDLFGGSALEGKPYIEVIRNPEFLDLVETVKKNKVAGSTEIILELDEDKHFSVRLSPVYHADNPAGVVAIFHDTTRMTKLEHMRKDFVANVSHEIKTPVTAIRGFAETLLDGAIDEKENALKFLNTIKFNSERLNRLVDDLLTISGLELGSVQIRKSAINIEELFDNVINTIEQRASEKNIAIKRTVINENNIINADRDRIEQILLNLIDNAVKFTESGEVEIGRSRDGDRDYIFVKDSGIGIPGKYLNRLGERFFRVDPSRSREMGGTGLGLAIVKHLVKAHDWTMDIQSEAGQGTIVKIYYS